MNKTFFKIISITLAGILLVCSLAILPFNAISTKAENADGLQGSEILDYYKIACLVSENRDLITDSYIFANDLIQIALDYKAACDNATVSEDQNTQFKTAIDHFQATFSAMFETTSSTVKFLMPMFAKIGLFVRSASVLYNIVTRNEYTHTATLLDMLRNGFTTDNKEIDPDKVYTVSPHSQSGIKQAAADAIKEDRGKIYTLVPTYKISEVATIVRNEFPLTEYTAAYLNCIQYMYDKLEDDQIMFSTVFLSYKATSFYIMDELVNADSYRYFTSNYHSQWYYSNYGECLTNNKPTELYKDSLSPNSKIYYPCMLTGENPDTARYMLPYVTTDGRPVKVWASESMYLKYSDWSNGCPYDIITSSAFDKITDDSIKPFSIYGRNIENVNMEQIYNNIVNNCVTNNDYSDNSVQNVAYDYSQTVINNYYITEDSGDEPGEDDPTEDEPTTPSKPNSDMLKWLVRAAQIILLTQGVELPEGVAEFLTMAIEILPIISEFCDQEDIQLPSLPTGTPTEEEQCTKHINSFVEEIDSMGELFPSLFEKMAVWKKLPNDIGNFVQDGLSWLPKECIALIVSGVAAMVGIGIWKMIRG